MNNIYKVVWNAGLQMFQVVSELAKGKSKSRRCKQQVSDASSACLPACLPALTFSSLFLFSTNSFAADPEIEQLRQEIANLRQEISTLKIKQIHGVSVSATSNDSNYNNNGATGSYSVAVGNSAKATGLFSIALGGGTADGTQSTKAEGGQSIAIGVNANAKSAAGLAIGWNAISNNQYSLALGPYSNVSGNNGIAVGTVAKALGNSAISIGTYSNSSSSAINGISIGTYAQSAEEHTIALGTLSKALGVQTLALGFNSSANGQASVVIGSKNKTSSKSSLVAGTESEITDYANSSIALGSSAYVGKSKEVNPNAYIDGRGTIIDSDQSETGTLGSTRAVAKDYAQMNVEPTRKYFSSVAIGNSAKALGYQTLAIGGTAEASATNSMALGIAAEARGHFSNALGKQAIAYKNNAIALGYYSAARSESAIALGDNSTVQTESGIALGSNSFNERGTGAIGYDFSEKNTKHTNSENKIANGQLLGTMKTEYDRLTTEITPLETDFNNTEKAYYKLVEQRDVEFNLKKQQEKVNELTTQLTALKAQSKPKQDEITKVENEKTAAEEELTKLNEKNTALLAETNVQSDKLSDEIAAKETELETKKQALLAKKEERNKIISVWQGTAGSLSIGNDKKGITRQIIGVAAGTEDTDAVNVAQLKSLKNAGLTFAMNDYDKDQVDNTKDKLIKKEIGGIFHIQGKSDLVYNDANKANYTSNNLVTFNDSGVLRIGMLKSPSFTGVTLGEGNNTVSLTVDNGVLKAGSKTIFTEDNFKTFFTKLYTFEGGLKTEDKDGKTVISLNKETIKQMPELKGDKGADGKSAYELWKAKDGNQGKTEEEFLTSIKGADGKSAYDIWKEKPENEGKSKDDFLTATKGADGKSAYDLWKAKDGNQGKTEEEFLTSIKGPKGEKGKSAYDSWKELPANQGKSETEFAEMLGGGASKVELQQLRTEHDSLKAQIRKDQQSIQQLDRNMQKMNKDLRAGIAGATAIAFLQGGNFAGESAVSVAVGTYKGEHALAVGYGRRLTNNKIEIKLGASVNSQSDVNAGGSVGYHW